MSLGRRGALWGAAGLLAAGRARAGAEDWPTRPIRLVVPFAPGGASDLLARLLAERLAPALGQPVIVENRPGAGATIGADAVAKARPDGATILYGTPGPQIVNPYLMRSLPYDADRDFTPIVSLVRAPNLLVVNPALPVRNGGRADRPGQGEAGGADLRQFGDRRFLAHRRGDAEAEEPGSR